MNKTGRRIIADCTMKRKTPKARAFTMLELLLVIVILVLIVVVAWPGVGAQTSGGQLDYAARQLTGLFQMARSQAMLSGKIHQCRFDADGVRATIEAETDPINQPGVYESIGTHWARVDFGREQVRCLEIRFDHWEMQLKQQEANLTEGDDINGEGDVLLPIVFHPDGTSDSAILLLEGKDQREVTITINGMTGQIRIEQGNMLHEADSG